jgi:anion-transporting  ArsA/GET3 family ATPase
VNERGVKHILLQLKDVSDVLMNRLKDDSEDFGAFGIVVRKAELNVTNSLKRKLRPMSSKYTGIKLMTIHVDTPIDEWVNSLDILGKDAMLKLAQQLELQIGDNLLLTYGERDNCVSSLKITIDCILKMIFSSVLVSR